MESGSLGTALALAGGSVSQDLLPLMNDRVGHVRDLLLVDRNLDLAIRLGDVNRTGDDKAAGNQADQNEGAHTENSPGNGRPINQGDLPFPGQLQAVSGDAIPFFVVVQLPTAAGVLRFRGIAMVAAADGVAVDMQGAIGAIGDRSCLDLVAGVAKGDDPGIKVGAGSVGGGKRDGSDQEGCKREGAHGGKASLGGNRPISAIGHSTVRSGVFGGRSLGSEDPLRTVFNSVDRAARDGRNWSSARKSGV
jgi:hypothetical protein